MDNVSDWKRLPLEGKLSTKETDEVFKMVILCSDPPHPSLRATFSSRGRLMTGYRYRQSLSFS
jgi:hypothetical protein